MTRPAIAKAMARRSESVRPVSSVGPAKARGCRPPSVVLAVMALSFDHWLVRHRACNRAARGSTVGTLRAGLGDSRVRTECGPWGRYSPGAYSGGLDELETDYGSSPPRNRLPRLAWHPSCGYSGPLDAISPRPPRGPLSLSRNADRITYSAGTAMATGRNRARADRQSQSICGEVRSLPVPRVGRAFSFIAANMKSGPPVGGPLSSPKLA
jgi:hypothetical protein